MNFANRFPGARRLLYLMSLGAMLALALAAGTKAQGLIPIPAVPSGGTVELSAQQQRKEGDVFIADGNVDIHYGEMRLQADHVEYNSVTNDVVAQGHVQFDYQVQQINGERAEYNIKSGRGTFQHVRGWLHVMRRPNPEVYVTPNPLYFEADSLERLDASTYRIHKAKMTVCDPDRPVWNFDTREATLHVDKTVALLDSDFRVLRIPLLYVPYASLPAGRKLRQSGFLLPEFGHSTIKGTVVGDAYYWAPTYWMDATVGAQIMTARGWSQTTEVRLDPWENVTVSGAYYGVVDRQQEGGHQFSIKLDARLAHGWRAVADVHELSSLTFQLVFAGSFNEAVNSEVSSTAFLTNNFNGFSINFAANDYKNYLNAATSTTPETSISLGSLPEVRFDSVDRAPWKDAPFYFGVDAYTDGVYRSDPDSTTPPLVDRSEFAPRMTIPLHWGPYLGVTSTYSLLATGYGAQLNGLNVVDTPAWRTVGEFSMDIRPPTLERVWQRSHSKWKHTIEPQFVYNYATGVNDFARFIRIDEDDTISDTNEMQYSVTQRLYRSTEAGGSQEVLSWSLLQKYFFDPTFGGALVAGQSNIFQTLDAVSAFAFADGPRHFSPLVSDLKVMPGGTYDVEFRQEFDPVRQRLTTSESLLKLHPYKNLELTAAHYYINASEVLQPVSNQIRLLVGYGGLNRKGWGATVGVSYDIRQGVAENELFQVNYNADCCGLAVGYQRLNLGQIRNENQFRVSFVLANIGNFGNMRNQEKVF